MNNKAGFTLYIKLAPYEFTYTLKDAKSKVIDIQTTKYYHKIDEELINSLDKFFKKNKIYRTSLSDVKLQAGITDKSSTHFKVAIAFQKGLLLGISN